jgi:hypothetical protein
MLKEVALLPIVIADAEFENIGHEPAISRKAYPIIRPLIVVPPRPAPRPTVVQHAIFVPC